MSMSYWKQTIKYINKYGYDIRPIDIINITDGSTASIAGYINYLHNAQYLKRINRGVYIRMHKIPENLTVNKIKKFIYPKGVSYNDSVRFIERYWKIKTLKDKIK